MEEPGGGEPSTGLTRAVDAPGRFFAFLKKGTGADSASAISCERQSYLIDWRNNRGVVADQGDLLCHHLLESVFPRFRLSEDFVSADLVSVPPSLSTCVQSDREVGFLLATAIGFPCRFDGLGVCV